MIDTLITSKTRIKILLKFFLNGSVTSYLRNLETELNESTNSIRLELNKFEEAGLLNTKLKGNKKLFKANVRHPLFSDIQSILRKYTGIDKITEHVIQKLGNPDAVYLVGDLARGIDSRVIDLIFVGDIEQNYLVKLTLKAEKLIDRKIRFVIFTKEEFEANKSKILEKSYFNILS